MNNDWQKYLGLAQRAGAVLYGIDNINSARQKIELIILDAESATQNLVLKVENFASKKNINLIKLQKKLDECLHSKNCKVVGITNKDLANQIESKIKE
ncbi:MAG: hypothetical protein J6C13_02065 [Clostridia bacterium]|nr:hypothetical protein [Clostridia bacterium]